MSRIAIGTFVLFHGACEAVLGIATGVLVRKQSSGGGRALPLARRRMAAGRRLERRSTI